MRRGTLVTILALVASCGEPPAAPVRTSIVSGFSAPHGVLERTAVLELRVLDGGTCNPLTGIVTDRNARELSRTILSSTGCTDNAKFCGDVTLDKSAEPRVFGARALGADRKDLAFGCVIATIDQDAPSIAIRMFRVLAPAVCGDGKLQPTEQCEPGTGGLCDSCQTPEILLSEGAPANNTATGKAGDKSDAFFAWPQAGGDTGRFIAVYTDRAVIPSGDLEIGLRVMSAELAPAAAPAALTRGSIFLPNGGAFPTMPAPRQQSLPQSAFFASRFYVAFQEDDPTDTAPPEVQVRTINAAFQSEGITSMNGAAGSDRLIQTSPAISAGANRLLVVWHDPAGGGITGRTLSPPATLGARKAIGGAGTNPRPSLAPLGKGWVVVWTTDAGVRLRTLDENGDPTSGEQLVTEGGAEGARVASLPDGRYAVVWSKGGDIFVQRYESGGGRLVSDQREPVNDLVRSGAQTQPAIAATSAVRGSFVVAWHDGSSGHIRARALGGTSGFLFNHVNGQDSEFQASRNDGRVRAAPVVAAGGSGPFVAIGWEDRTMPGAGIVVRRFPVPNDGEQL